jgi:hypothetical protein
LNAVFLELPVVVEDVLPVPVAKKAKLSLGALTSLGKSEKTSSSPAASPRILKKDGSLGFFGFFWSVFASFL